MIWPVLKTKTQSLTWFAIISLKVGDFYVLTLTSPSPSSTPVPSQQHPEGYLNSEQVCSNLTPLHQTFSSPITQSKSHWKLLTMEHFSLSKPAVARAPPHTCQADLCLQGFWGAERFWAHSVWRAHGAIAAMCKHGQAQGGNTAELRHQAGSAHPCSPSFPEHGPKNRRNQVSKRKRNGKVKCHDLRHGLRLLFSWRSSPSLGPPTAFPDQKQPGRAPWARPSAVASDRGVLPFYPSPSAFLPPATGSFLAWGKALVGTQGSIPVSLPQSPHRANPSTGALARATLILGCLSPTLYQVGAGRHPEFSLHDPTSLGFPCLAHMAALLCSILSPS